MRISTHNGLEVWLEWRPAVSRLANNVEEALGPWTRLGERPPRVVSGEVLITRGAVEIDVDTLAKHREIEYRLGVRQANYHDWPRDLRVEIKSDDTVLGVVYLIPEQEQAKNCPLAGWSPISQDELAAALASKLGMSDMIPPDVPELESCVDEEALKALFESDVDTTEVRDSPVLEAETSTDLVLDAGIETGPTEAVLDLVTDDSPNSPITGSNLEISVYRGQHTILPPTPPPDYIEGDLGNGLYNRFGRLSFGGNTHNRDEWSPEDPEGVAWCKFVYEVSTETQQVATSTPFILDSEESARLLAEFDEYALMVEMECRRKQEEERENARQRLQDEERKRREESEDRHHLDVYNAVVAEIRREKNSERSRKGWKTRFDRGDFKGKHPPSTSTLIFRPDSRSDRSFRHSNGLPKRNHHKKRVTEYAHTSRAGPSALSGRSDHRRKSGSACNDRETPEPVQTPLKRSRSRISDGGQIILPPREDRDGRDTPAPKSEPKPQRRSGQIHDSGKAQTIRSSRDNCGAPSPARLHFEPRYRHDRHEGGRLQGQRYRNPEMPRRVERSDTNLDRARPCGLRRTDEPADYGLPVARHRRERGDGQVERVRSSHHRNIRRLDDRGDRYRSRSCHRDDGNRERDDRDARQRREARDAQVRREERERRNRREAREKLEREEAEKRAEEEERNLGPMEEQVRAFEEREYQRSVKREQIERKEERRRERRLGGTERHPIPVSNREVKREREGVRRVDRGSRLSVRGAVIDMTDLSDSQ